MLATIACILLWSSDPTDDGFRLLARWKFDSGASSSRIRDLSGRGSDLSGNGRTFGKGGWSGASDEPLGRRGADLGIAGNRIVRYQAKIYLDAYPSPLLHNGRSVAMGYYAGPKILVTDQGAVQAGGQKGGRGIWNWYAPESAPGAVPLGRWTIVSIEADPRGTWRAWVDGREVEIRSRPVAGDSLRPSQGTFSLGSDPVDGQLFPGWISEAWVWEKPLGASPRPTPETAPIQAGSPPEWTVAGD